jgi:predicted small metal-binding protein
MTLKILFTGISIAQLNDNCREPGEAILLQASCKDVGVGDCDIVAEGKKDRQVRAKMIEHMRDVHPKMVAGIEHEQLEELEARIKSSTRTP